MSFSDLIRESGTKKLLKKELDYPVPPNRRRASRPDNDKHWYKQSYIWFII